MYKAYSVSCNIKGGKAIGTFIAGLIAAEIISKACIVLLLFPMAAAKISPKPAPQSNDLAATQTNALPSDIASNGEQFVDLLAREDFAAAVARFDATMANALPEAKLRDLWHDLTQKTGPFQKQLTTTLKEQQGYQIALVTCQFEHASLDIKVVFDSNNRIAGLFFVPTGSP